LIPQCPLFPIPDHPFFHAILPLPNHGDDCHLGRDIDGQGVEMSRCGTHRMTSAQRHVPRKTRFPCQKKMVAPSGIGKRIKILSEQSRAFSDIVVISFCVHYLVRGEAILGEESREFFMGRSSGLVFEVIFPEIWDRK